MSIVAYILGFVLIALGVTIAVLLVKYWERLTVFVEEVKFEMSKVSWPSRDDVINSTVLVFVTVIALTTVVWLVDLVLSKAVHWLF